MSDEKPKVLLTCCNMGWLHRTTLPQIVWAVKDPRYHVDIEVPQEGDYCLMMNQVAQSVIGGKYDYWLNMDDDNGPSRNALDLVELGLDIVGLPTPIWKGGSELPVPFFWSAVDRRDDGRYIQHDPLEGLQEVDAVGSGCMVVSRRVIEGLTFPLFKRVFSDDGCSVIKGPDYFFCEKARAAGFKVHTHCDYTCNHVKEVELHSMIKAMVKFTRECNPVGEGVAEDVPQPVTANAGVANVEIAVSGR